MPQGISHCELIDQILLWSKTKFDLSKTVTFVDDRSNAFEKPPKIGNSVPDVLIKSIRSDLTILGEAKTFHDLGNRRFDKQMDDYLSYLCRNEWAHLVVFTERSSFDHLCKRIKSHLKKHSIAVTDRVHLLSYP